MSDTKNPMDPQELDIFREIGNIGAGNAATSLSAILGRKVEMSVPEVRIVPFHEVSELLGMPETPVVGGMVDLEGGDLSGQIMLIMGLEEAYNLASAVCKIKPEAHTGHSVFDFSDFHMSALNEVTNILVGSYLSAVSSLTGLSIIPSVPSLNADMAGAMLSIIAIKYGETGDYALFFKTEFTDIQDRISCSFFLLPDRDSHRKLLLSLGVAH